MEQVSQDYSPPADRRGRQSYRGEPRREGRRPERSERRGGISRRLFIKGGLVLTAAGVVGGFLGREWWRRSHTVDMGSLPESCPQPVREASRSILDVGFGNPDNPFSGVQVRSNEFSNGISVTVRPNGSWPGEATLTGRKSEGSGTVRAQSESKTPIDGVIAVGTEGRLGEVRAIGIRERTPERGEMLFCLDYGRTEAGGHRYPAADPETGLNLPAIYGGPLLVSRDREGRGICLTVKNFGEGVPETGPRKGSRGGAVVDKDGKLVGIIVDASAGTIDQIEQQYGITIKSMSPEDRAKEYLLTVFQPFTPDTLGEFEDRFNLHNNEHIEYLPVSSSNPRVENTDPQSDILNLEARNANGELVPVSGNLLEVVGRIADNLPITLTCCISGHSYDRSDAPGTPSDHSTGHGVDLGFGFGSDGDLDRAQEILDFLYTNRDKPPYKDLIKEILLPPSLAGRYNHGRFKGHDQHDDHIHLAVHEDSR